MKNGKININSLTMYNNANYYNHMIYLSNIASYYMNNLLIYDNYDNAVGMIYIESLDPDYNNPDTFNIIENSQFYGNSMLNHGAIYIFIAVDSCVLKYVYFIPLFVLFLLSN